MPSLNDAIQIVLLVVILALLAALFFVLNRKIETLYRLISGTDWADAYGHKDD